MVMAMGMGLWGLLAMLLFWGGLIALAILLVKALFPGSPQPPPPSQESDGSARAILDKRYARGELSSEQYEMMKQDLEG